MTKAPKPVMKLGPEQRDCIWVDSNGQAWRWTDSYWWQRRAPGEWVGSYATVEGAAPYYPAGEA